MTETIPKWSDLFAGEGPRRAFLSYWRGMTVDDWRDLATVAVLRRLPVNVSSAFGAVSASIRGPKVYSSADQLARLNLARLRPDLSEQTREQMLTTRWQCVGRTMAEYSVSDRLGKSGRLALEGLEHLSEAQEGGRGVVFAALHLGNWEVFIAALGAGAKMATFYEPRPTRAREYITQTSRRRLGYKLMSPSSSGLRNAIKALADGEIVTIFVDEELNGVVRGPLFGRHADKHSNLIYAARLARRVGAPIVPVYVLRKEETRFVAHIEPGIQLDQGSGNSLLQDVNLINSRIEPIILAHLDQWYNLHEKLDEPPLENRL